MAVLEQDLEGVLSRLDSGDAEVDAEFEGMVARGVCGMEFETEEDYENIYFISKETIGVGYMCFE